MRFGKLNQTQLEELLPFYLNGSLSPNETRNRSLAAGGSRRQAGSG